MKYSRARKRSEATHALRKSFRFRGEPARRHTSLRRTKASQGVGLRTEDSEQTKKRSLYDTIGTDADELVGGLRHLLLIKIVVMYGPCLNNIGLETQAQTVANFSMSWSTCCDARGWRCIRNQRCDVGRVSSRHRPLSK